MQSAAIRLQLRQRAASLLAACERLINCTASIPCCTSSGRVGQSLFDQQPVSGSTQATVSDRSAFHRASGKGRLVPLYKAFTSSAEFSGGKFKVSSPASQEDDRHSGAAEVDIDDRVILLEASLGFVVIVCDYCMFVIVFTNIPLISSSAVADW